MFVINRDGKAIPPLLFRPMAARQCAAVGEPSGTFRGVRCALTCRPAHRYHAGDGAINRTMTQLGVPTVRGSFFRNGASVPADRNSQLILMSGVALPSTLCWGCWRKKLRIR